MTCDRRPQCLVSNIFNNTTEGWDFQGHFSCCGFYLYRYFHAMYEMGLRNTTVTACFPFSTDCTKPLFGGVILRGEENVHPK